jgi:hypothetical protein
MAVHESGPFVVFDVAVILGFWHFNLLAETLLLEIACEQNLLRFHNLNFTSAITDSKFICKREEMQNIQSNVIVLEVIHQVSAVALDLLI